MSHVDATAVIATYGDEAQLAWALAQARDLGLDVRVYRGHSALAVPSVDGVAVADGTGAHALAATLRGVEGLVLHLHDDVAVGPTALRALLDAHAATGAIVVPRVNEQGIDHAHGALLPRCTDAQAAVEAASTGDPSSAPAVSVSPACVLGTREQVMSLAPFRISFPGTVLTSVASDIRAVAGAVVAHDGTERTFTHLEPGDDRPVLVASMIVRDEEGFLPDCLDSLEGVVDRIDVCDTGSTDGTLDLLAARGIEPMHRTWRDDFAWARNEVLEVARDAIWAIQVDADERLEVPDPAMLRRVLRAAEDEFDTIEVTMVDGGPGKTWGSRWLSQRIIRPSVAHFFGALHEEPRSRATNGPLRRGSLPMVVLHHLGYANHVVTERDKLARNLRISRQAWEQDPTLEHTLHYARSHELAGEPADERVALWERVVDLLVEPEARHHAYILGMLATTLLNCRPPRTDRARELAEQALEILPHERVALAAHAHASLALGDPQAVLDSLARAEEAPSLRPVFTDDHTTAQIATFHAYALASLGRSDEAREVAERALRDGAGSTELWAFVLDLDAARGEPARTDDLVVAVGSPMGYRAHADRRDHAAVLAMTERFLAAHDVPAIRAFGARLAGVLGRLDLQAAWTATPRHEGTAA